MHMLKLISQTNSYKNWSYQCEYD